MKKIPVSQKLLERLFKAYDAMKLFEEIHEWDSEMAAHKFFQLLEQVYKDEFENGKEET